MTKRKAISPAVRMQALALFTMANQNYLRADAYGKALSELLGYRKDEYGGVMGDAWLDADPDFDKAFAEDGFKVRFTKRK